MEAKPKTVERLWSRAAEKEKNFQLGKKQDRGYKDETIKEWRQKNLLLVWN